MALNKGGKFYGKVQVAAGGLLVAVFFALSAQAAAWTETQQADWSDGLIFQTTWYPSTQLQLDWHGSTTGATVPSAVSWMPGWDYRKAITINNAGGGPLSDYQVLVTSPVFDETGLVGSWHLDGGTSGSISNGATAGLQDTSGNSNNGTASNANGTGMAWTIGKASGAVIFDGVDDYVQATSAFGDVDFKNTNFSVELWLNRAVTTEQRPFYLGTVTGTNYGFEIGTDNTATQVWANWHRSDANATGRAAILGNTTVAVGNWYHIVVTHTAGEPSTANTRIYVNGSSVTTSGPSPYGHGPYVMSNIVRLSGDFNGNIDEPRVYNRALSAAEIQARYQAKAKPNYDDIRFTKADGTTVIPHWMEADGKFWVKVSGANSIPVGNSTVYAYYGSSSAVSVSDYFSAMQIIGDGSSGPLTVSAADTVVNNYTYLTGNESAGDNSIAVNSGTGFSNGDEILIIQMQNYAGGVAGTYEFRKISSGGGTATLTLDAPLKNSYASGTFDSATATVAQIVRVPQYTNVTVNSGASITATAWNGYSGGIVALKANGTVTVASGGTINATSKGFRGGLICCIAIGYINGYQGESYKSTGTYTQAATAEGGGGAGKLCGAGNTAGGGGGSYATAGTNGYIQGSCTAGAGGTAIFGSSDLSVLFFGGAAGAGYAGPTYNSGGIIFIGANTLTNSGSIAARGGDGGQVIAPSGASAGGSIFITANTLTAGSNTILATAGAAAIGGLGAGGDGRIRLGANSISGTSNPSAYTSGFDTDHNRKYSPTEPVSSAGVEEGGYFSTGTYKSNVLDAGADNAFLTSVAWNPSGLPAGTTVAVAARVSNTAFAAGDPTPAWTAVTNGGNPGIYGRYIQYMSTFTTADVSTSSRIEDITLTYGFLNAPSGLSGTADSPSQITWNWTDNSPNPQEDGFKVYDSLNNLKGTVGANVVSWAESSGLSPNTQYTRYVQAYSGSVVSNSGNASRYTLPVTPTDGNIPCDKSASTPYNAPFFTFTNTSGFGTGAVQYFKYKWDANPSETTFPDTWSGGDLTLSLTAPGTYYYLHLKAYNADDAANPATLTKGPYVSGIYIGAMDADETSGQFGGGLVKSSVAVAGAGNAAYVGISTGAGQGTYVVGGSSGWKYRKAVTINNASGGALSDYQVLVTSPVYNETDLVGSWHFEVDNSTADSSNIGNSLTPNGGVTCSSSGFAGGGCSFNGSNGFMSKDSGVTGIGGTNRMTYEAWVKRNDNVNGGIYALGNTAIYNFQYLILDANKVSAAFGNTANDNFKALTTVSVLTDTTSWHHIVATYDAGTVKMYVDGVEWSGTTSGSWTGAVVAPTTYLRIGNYFNGGNVGHLNGKIDEVRIYNRALSVSEIQAHYAAKVKPNYDDMRFTKTDGTAVSHWMESDGRFWVKIPGANSIPTGNSTIYAYYGNSSTGSVSDGASTFDFFDDFSGDLSKWNKVGSPAIVSGELTITGNTTWNQNAVRTVNTFARPLTIEWNEKSTISSMHTQSGYHASLAICDGSAGIYKYLTNSKEYIEHACTSDMADFPGGGLSQTTVYNRYKLEVLPTSGHKAYRGSTPFASFAGYTDTNYGVGFNVNSASAEYYDDVRVRKYSSTEPVSSMGSEEPAEGYFPTGEFQSRILDSGASGRHWGDIGWRHVSPSGTAIQMRTRTGNTATPDGSWSSWYPPSGFYTASTGTALTVPDGRYLQYASTFTTSVSTVTPILDEVTATYGWLNAPSGLSGTADSPSQITWNWTDNSATPQNEDGFKIYDQGSSLKGTASQNAVSWIESSGLSPNTQYTRYAQAYAPGLTANSGNASRYTLAVTPTGANITCDKSVSTPYNAPFFTFTNTSGFGTGTVQYFKYKWDANPSETTFPDTWSGGDLTLSLTAPGTYYYLHLKAYNAEDAANPATLTKGPYVSGIYVGAADTDESSGQFGGGLVKSSVTVSGTGNAAYAGLTNQGAFSVDGASGWNFRREINIGNGGVSGLSDYQVFIPTTSFGSSWAAIRSSAQATMADFRFTMSTATTSIPYWIDGGTASPSGFWVKVSSIPTSGTKIHIYYGNSSAVSVSSGPKTFEYFDDFEGGGLLSWTDNSGTWANAGGYRKHTAGGPYYQASYISIPLTDYIVTAKAYFNSAHAGIQGLAVSKDAGTGNYWRGGDIGYMTADSVGIFSDDQSHYGSVATGTDYRQINTWYRIQVARVGSSSIKAGGYNANTYNTAFQTEYAIALTNGIAGLVSNNSVETWFDDFFVRKYAATEPAIGIIGAEELLGYFSSGEFQSRVIDSGGSGRHWGDIGWRHTSPAGTSVQLRARTGNTGTPDGSWSSWYPPAGWYTASTGTALTVPDARYLQYASTFTSSVSTATPFLDEVTATYGWLNAPTGFSGTANSDTQITWNWADNSAAPQNEDGFKIYDQGSSLKATVGANAVSWAESPLSPNTQYTRYVQAYAPGITANSGNASRYTLPVAPTDGNIPCDKAVSTPYNTPFFTFTNTPGFGAGTVQYYKYKWDANSSPSTFPDTWSGGDLTLSLTAPGTSYYLHLKAYNGEDAANTTTLTKGPYVSGIYYGARDADETSGQFGGALSTASVMVSGTGGAAYVRLSTGGPNFVVDGASGWNYRREINISNGGTYGLTDYQIFIPTTSFGSNWAAIRSSAQATMADFRFTMSTSTASIPYWIDSDTASPRGFWVKVSSIPTAGTKIHMYYGNSSAAGSSNGANTFEFFDDFEDNNIADWTPVFGSADAVSGKIHGYDGGTGGDGRVKKPFTLGSAIWEFALQLSAVNGGNNADNAGYYLLSDGVNGGSNYRFALSGQSGVNFLLLYRDAVNLRQDAWTADTNNHIVKITRNGSGTFEVFFDGAFIGSATDTTHSSLSFLDFYYSGGGGSWPKNFYSDYIRVRKYAATEPAIGVTGGEEPAGYFPSGEFQSRTLDGGASGRHWGDIGWRHVSPSGTSIQMRARTGNTATPDGSWSSWYPLSGFYTASTGTALTVPDGRYLQYASTFTTSVSTATPILDEATATYGWLNAPSGLSGTADSPSQITWNWTDNSAAPQNEDGFKIYDQGSSLKGTAGQNAISWIESSGLSPNTQYTRYVQAYAPGLTANSGNAAGYTLPVAPTAGNLPCDKAVSTPYNAAFFTFTNNSGFGAGGVQYFKYKWDTNPSETVFPDTWSGGVLTLSIPEPGASYYLHIKAYNGADAANPATLTRGPYLSGAYYGAVDTDETAGQFGGGLVKSSVTVSGTGNAAYVRLSTNSAGSSFTVDGASGWNFRREINIGNGGASGLSDYQVFIPTTSFGSNWAAIRSSAQATMADFRFTLSTAAASMPYWIESDTTSPRGFWVKVSSIPTTGTKIHMYYGNLSAVTASSAPATFDFFDDHNDGFFDTSKWSTAGSAISNHSESAYPGSVWFSGQWTYGWNYMSAIPTFNLPTITSSLKSYHGVCSGGSTQIQVIGATTHSYELPKDQVYRTYRAYKTGGNVVIDENGVVKVNEADTNSLFQYKLAAYCDGNDYISQDYIHVRKSASVEPSIGVIGGEELAGYFPSGEFQSRVLDSGASGRHWGYLGWKHVSPSGAGINMQVRTGNTAAPDGSWSSWSGWSNASTGTALAVPDARYLQYRSSFTAPSTVTPVLDEVTAAYTWLNAPTGFSGTADSPTQITWNWTDASAAPRNEDGFDIYDQGSNLKGNVGPNTSSWVEAFGLNANTQYTRYVQAYVPGITANSGNASRYTLPVAPTGANITCDKAVSTVYDTPFFTFTNTAGFGTGAMQYLKYKWDTNPSETTFPDTWPSETLSLSILAPGTSYYLHLKSYNAEDAGNPVTLTKGPYVSGAYTGVADTDETSGQFGGGLVKSLVTVSGTGNAAYVRLSAGGPNFSVDGASGWNFRREINITNVGTYGLTDYQVFIPTTSFGSSWAAIRSSAQATMADFRFTMSTSTVSIPYWIDSDTTTPKGFWVKVSSIPAAGTKIHMYYGNPTATYDNSLGGKNAFVVWDNFTPMTEQWTTVGDGSSIDRTVNNRINLGDFNNSSDRYLYKSVPALDDFYIEYNTTIISQAAGGTFGTGLADVIDDMGGVNKGLYVVWGYANYVAIRYESAPGNVYTESSSIATTTGQKYTAKLSKFGSTATLNVFDYTTKSELSGSPVTLTNAGLSTLSLGVSYAAAVNTYASRANSGYIHDMRVRKYASAEPSVASIGAEELSGYYPSGEFQSRAIDSGAKGSRWGGLAWAHSTPPGAGIKMRVRTGDTSVPDGTWSAWYPLTGWYTASTGTPITAPWAQYAQYQSSFTTVYSTASPQLAEADIWYSANTSSAPGLVSPADAVWLSSARPVFKWTFADSEADAQTGFRVELATHSSLLGSSPYAFAGAPAHDSGGVASSTQSYQPGTDINNGVYYWHVKTSDTYGAWSVYSSTWQIRLDTAAPAGHSITSVVPQITSCAVNFSVPSDLFSGLNALPYSVRYSTSSLFEAAVSTVSDWFAGAGTVTLSMRPGTTYYFAVRARDAVLNEVWSSSYALPTLADPPGLALSPYYVYTSSAVVRWDNKNNAAYTQYRVQRSAKDDSGFTVVEGDSQWKTGISSWTFASLTTDSTYYFRVKARNPGGLEAPSGADWALMYSTQTPVNTPLASAPDIYITSITAHWDANNDPGTPFYVELSTNSDFSTQKSSSGWQSDLTSYAFGGLVPNTNYFIRARARNSSGVETPNVSLYGEYTRAELPGGTVSPYTRTGSEITVNWNRNGNPDPGTGYYAMRSSTQDFSLDTGVSGWTPNNSHQFTGLAPGTTYYFRVKARNNNASPYETGWQVLLSSVTSPAPAPPTNLTFSYPDSVSTDRLTLNWNDNAINELGFRVYESTDGAVYSLKEALANNSMTYLSLSLSANTLYYYKVAAYNVNGESFTNAASTYTLAAQPAAQAMSDVSHSSLKANWDGGTNPAWTAYVCELSTKPGFSPLLASSQTVLTGAVFSSLASNATYYARVKAVNGSGAETPYTNLGSTGTLPIIITVTAPDMAPGGITQGQSVPYAKITVTPSWNNAVWSGLTVNRTGTGSDQDVTRVSLMRDGNSNGAFEPGNDPEVGWGVFASSAVTLSLNEVLNSGATYFVVLLVADNYLSWPGNSIGISIVSTASFVSSNSRFIMTPPSFASGLSAISKLADTLSVIPTSVAPVPNVIRSQSNTAFLKLSLTAGRDRAYLNGLTVRKLGTLADNYAGLVKVYLDSDQSGQYNAGDALLSSGVDVFVSSQAAVQFVNPSTRAVINETYFVSLDIDAAAPLGASVGVRVANSGAFSLMAGMPDTVNLAVAPGDSTLPTVADPPNVLIVTPASMGITDVEQGETAALERVQFVTDSGNALLSGFKVQRSSSSADGDYAMIALYRDNAPLGSFSAASDSLVSSGTFSSGQFTFPLAETITYTSTKAYFIVAGISPSANASNQVGVVVQSGYITPAGGQTAVSAPVPFASALARINYTVDTIMVTPDASVSPGSVYQGASAVPLLKLEVKADKNAAAMTNVTLDQIGSADDADLSSVRVYKDNGDGVFAAAQDTAVTGGDSFSGGTLTASFSPVQNVTVSSGAYFVVADIAGTANPGRTVRLRLAGASYVGVLAPDLVTSTFPIVSNVVNLEKFPATVLVSSVSLAPASAQAGTGNIPMMKLTVRTNQSTAELTALSVIRQGGADAYVSGVKLYWDANANGSADANEMVSSGVFTAGALSLPLSGPAKNLSAVSKDYLVTMGFSSSAAIGASISAGFIGMTITSPDSVEAGRLPVYSGGVQVAEPPSQLLCAFENKLGASATQGDAAVLVASVTLRASAYSVNWTRFDALRAGAGADADISALKLYADNGNGTWGGVAEENFVASGTFLSGQATLNFSPQNIAYPAARTFYVTVDVSNVATAGGAFGIDLPAAGYLGAQAPDTVGAGGFPFSSALAALNATVDTLVVGWSSLSPSVKQGDAAKALGRLTLNSSANSVSLTEIKVAKTGTAPDSDISGIQVYKDNGDGLFGAGDTLAGSASGLANGLASVLLSPAQEITTTAGDYFITAGFAQLAAIGATFGLTAGENDIKVVSPDLVSVTGSTASFSIAGVIGDSSDTVRVSFYDLASTSLYQGRSDNAMAKLTVRTLQDQAVLTAIKVGLAGTAALSDLGTVRVYSDSNANGSFDPATDAVAGSGTFASSVLTITLDASQPITAAPRDFFVVLDLPAGASIGATAGFNFANGGYFTLSGADGVETFAPAATVTAAIRDPKVPTPPAVNPVKADGTIALGAVAYNAYKTMLRFQWSCVVYEGSVGQAYYSIGPSPAASTSAWTSIGAAADVTVTGLNLTHAATYYLSVRVKNSLGEYLSDIVSREFVVDTLKPAIPSGVSIMEEGSDVSISWTGASVGPSGLLYYQIEERRGNSPEWTVAGTTSETTLIVTRVGYGVSAPGKPAGTYFYRLRAVNGAGVQGDASQPVTVNLGMGNLEALTSVSFYPNPFDSRKRSGTLNFTLNAASQVEITIYDIFGSKTNTMNIQGVAGANDVVWDGKDSSGAGVSKGIYLCVIKAAGASRALKVGVIH